MTRTQHTQGEDGDKLLDIPTPGDELPFGHDDHADDARERKQDGVLEGPGHLRDLDEEVGEGDLLGGGAPGHVDGEHVAEEGLGDVQGHAAEEDDEHETPFEILEDW